MGQSGTYTPTDVNAPNINTTTTDRIVALIFLNVLEDVSLMLLTNVFVHLDTIGVERDVNILHVLVDRCWLEVGVSAQQAGTGMEAYA